MWQSQKKGPRIADVAPRQPSFLSGLKFGVGILVAVNEPCDEICTLHGLEGYASLLSHFRCVYRRPVPCQFYAAEPFTWLICEAHVASQGCMPMRDCLGIFFLSERKITEPV